MDKIVKIRKKLLYDDRVVELKDFKDGSIKPYKVSDICKIASIPHKYGLILQDIIRKENPLKILEFGTSLGISALYICEAMSKDAMLTTIEGSRELSEIARDNLKGYNCRVINRTFDNTLSMLDKSYDLVFIDGHHNKGVLKYYKAVKSKTTVFDDINWSDEMKEVWQSLKGNKKSIGRFGIIK